VYAIFEYSEKLLEHAVFILGVIVAAVVVFGLYRLAKSFMDNFIVVPWDNAKQKLYKSKGVLMEDVTDLAFGIFGIAVTGSGIVLALLLPDKMPEGVVMTILGIIIGLFAGVPAYRNIRRSLKNRRVNDTSS